MGNDLGIRAPKLPINYPTIQAIGDYQKGTYISSCHEDFWPFIYPSATINIVDRNLIWMFNEHATLRRCLKFFVSHTPKDLTPHIQSAAWHTYQEKRFT